MALPRYSLSFLAVTLLAVSNAAASGRSTLDEDAASRDCRLTLKARQAFQQDAALARLALGITIQSGSAVIWGTAPSAETIRRAEERLRTVPGITRVRSEVQVLAPTDPLAEFLTRPPAPTPVSPPMLSSAFQGPATLTSRWADGAVELPFDAPLPKAEAPRVTLMAPQLLPGTPTNPRTASKPPAESLPAQVEQLQRSDPRFRGIQVEVTGGVVRLRGTVARAEDGMELAAKISRLPGVERVSLREVRSTDDR